MKTFLVYHKQDMDGIFSRFLIQRACEYNDHQVDLCGKENNDRRINVELIEANYDMVVVVDFSLEPSQMKYLHDRGKLVWIDHHAQAIEESIAYGYDKAGGLRSENRSAAWLALRFYENSIYQSSKDGYSAILKMTDLVDVRDRWVVDHVLFDEAKKFNTGIMGLGEDDAITWLNQTVDECDDPHEEISHIVTIGEAVTKSKEYYSKGFAKPHVAFIDGVMCISYNFIHNELSDSVDEDCICMMYVIQDKTVKVSLRSKSDRLNVAAMAAKYGGGGHKRAAGFNCSIKQLFEFLEH